ncbi:MAG: glycosyltransferase family 1 protein, partial [Alphaproteobacteria bacterium]
MLARHLPPGTAYLNVGHANLTGEVLAAWQGLAGARIAVLVHDTIPLDHPEFQRPGVPDRFAAMLARVGRAADLVICNSAFTEERLHDWLARLVPEASPATLVAHLGVEPAPPDASALPASLREAGPCFVCVGTIEPRKNHALLLDVWEALERELETRTPPLILAGSRGWENRAVFARLDAIGARGGPVREVPGLSDAAVSALVAGSAGLLFPSRAEGFGLPPAEAAVLGARVLCADLPVYREVLGDYPVYADPDDMYFWLQTTRRWAADIQADRRQGAENFHPPRWSEHFNRV